MIIEYREQMQYLLDNMEVLNKFVYSDGGESGGKAICTKIVPFASGENVKAISLMKY
jgi:hypothetical protein